MFRFLPKKIRRAIAEECVRVEEIEFSNAQAKGISNIDDFKSLSIILR